MITCIHTYMYIYRIYSSFEPSETFHWVKKNLPSQLAAMDSSSRARRGVTDDSMNSERKRFPGEFQRIG